MYGVYIVDDEGLIIKSIIQAISWGDNGFEVIGSNTSSVQAVEEIKLLRPHLVLCDLKMPAMDGISLIKTCRADGVDSEFIMLSAFGEFEASRNFFLLDGFDYMLKPLHPQEAEMVLERVSRKLAEKYDLHPSTDFAPTGAAVFDELVHYVSDNFIKKHTLSDLSSQFNLSEKYICSLFSKHYHSTLTMFLTNIRMNEATKMILTTDKALKEIAASCGYSDYFYFCRIFKNHFGESPTEYRQRRIEG